VPDGEPDLLDRAQAVSFALHQLSVLVWTMLAFPREMSGSLRLLVRALERGDVPKDEWLQAVQPFLPPAAPGWGLH
jgi:hypothetical protein